MAAGLERENTIPASMLQQAELGINNTALGTSTASKESRLLCTRLRKPPVLEHGNVPPPKGGEPLAAISDKDKPTWNAAAADDVPECAQTRAEFSNISVLLANKN